MKILTFSPWKILHDTYIFPIFVSAYKGAKIICSDKYMIYRYRYTIRAYI